MNSFSPTRPFNALPPLPPLEDLESKEMLKISIQAHRALARLEGSLHLVPNPSILLDSIGLQEAKVSSEIENIITTHDELYQYAIADRKIEDKATKEVLHYKDALWEAFAEVKAKGLLTTNLFVRIVQTIKENQQGIRNTPGTQVVNDRTGEVIYTPPEGEDLIRTKLKNLEDFLNLNDDHIDPLIKMAIAHYQFEAIHPFSDGNGRTGRIINILHLVQQNLLSMPILYMSRYILDNRQDYYRLLREVTESENWRPWITYMLRAVEETSLLTLDKIEAINQTMVDMGEQIKDQLPKIYSKDLVELLFHRPYTKRQFLEQAGIAKAKTAGVYLSQLEENGFLKSVELGRERLYLNKSFLEILKR